MLNSSTLLHHISIPDDPLWERVLSLIMEAPADDDMVEKALINWQNYPTERSFLRIMAGYIVPPAKPRRLKSLPDVACQPGDFGLINANTREWRSLSVLSASPNKQQQAQISAAINYGPIHISPSFSQDWQSVSFPNYANSEECEIKVTWNNQRSVDMEGAMWRRLKQYSTDISSCHNVRLTDLEIVTAVTLRVHIRPPLATYRSKGNLYFHRRTSPCASGTEFWGFFSRDRNPMTAKQDEAESADYRLKFETLSMADDAEQEANRLIEAELARMPGSFPSS